MTIAERRAPSPRRIFCLLAGSLAVLLIAAVSGVTPTAAPLPLLQQSDLRYEGAFRLPPAQSEQRSFLYGAMGLAFNPGRNSLYMVGHLWYQQTAEVTIPTITNSGNLANLATATLLQWGDATDGRLGTQGGKIYGQWVYGGQLYGAAYSATSPLSHFKSGLDLSVSTDFQGFHQVGSLDSRFVAGYMTQIPSEWQVALGGVALTGGCCNPGNNGATSLGPAAFVFSPSDLGQINPAPASPLVYYSQSHPTLGTWGNTTTINLAYNMMSEVVGVVFPPGGQSVLFFGRTGLSIPCYGNGTGDPALHKQPWPGGGAGAVYCYDPNEVGGGFGPHAYPYAYQTWAYNVQDFVAVKSGQKNPWDVRPYAIWTFDLPFEDSHRHIQGATFDPATSRIYLSQSGGEPSGVPLIHVFHIVVGSTLPQPPSPPLNLRFVP